MSRSRTAFLSGTITDNPLTNVATTINSAALASLPAIASPDIAVLVLDPTGSAGAPEVVYVTAHTGSATSATISRAAEGSSARQHASGIAWVHGPTLYDFKGWRLEAYNATEYTQATVTVADLATISGLLIPVTQPLKISFSFRKTSGAAAVGYFGLKINSTVVVEADASISSGLCNTSSTDRNEYGACTLYIGPRSTNYLDNMVGHYYTNTGAVIGTSNVAPNGAGAIASIPNATITSIAIRADSLSASITLGVKDISVEVLDT